MNISYNLTEKSFNEITAELAQAAMGILKADVVIRRREHCECQYQEIEEHKDVAIKHGRIVTVGKVDHTIGEDTQILMLLDTHWFPGSWTGICMLKAACCRSGVHPGSLAQGTTTIFMDPHEIANVLGMKGFR